MAAAGERPLELFLSHASEDRGQADAFASTMPPAAVASRWVKQELLYVLRETRFDRRILPIELAPCDWRRLSWTLRSIQAIRLAPDFEQGCRDVLGLWGIGLDSARFERPHGMARRRRRRDTD